jgi:hypothetical protein
MNGRWKPMLDLASDDGGIFCGEFLTWDLGWIGA